MESRLLTSRSLTLNFVPEGGFDMLESVGLFFDLTCQGGVSLTRTIMELAEILKVIWGADADLTSLKYQHAPIKLDIASQNVLDAQLAFSQPARRIGMKRMLRNHVPANLVKDLPDKSAVDFDFFHSQNKRAFPIPFPATETKYSLDDLHRIQVILHSQIPTSGGYQNALVATKQIQNKIDDPSNFVGFIRSEMKYFAKKSGASRLCKCVELTRAIKFSRIMDLKLSEADQSFIESVEDELSAILFQQGVVIPDDLSFADDQADSSQHQNGIQIDTRCDVSNGKDANSGTEKVENGYGIRTDESKAPPSET
jgi:hypothetical protein